MKNSIFLLLLSVLFACTKDSIQEIDMLQVNIDLLDAQGNSKRTFSVGEDLVFKYTEFNSSNSTIEYYGTHCPSFRFSVYTVNDSLLGDAIPIDLGCTDILKLLSIEPSELKLTEINWFNDPANQALPSGSYLLKFHNTISIIGTDQERNYDTTIPFIIE